MSRLIRQSKPPRSPFAPRLSVEQNGARLVQSKRDRKKTVIGIALRSAQHKAARWSGLAPKRGVSKSETRMQMAARIFGQVVA